jgi:hypothetical protein
MILIPLASAVNDPGHDSLYVLLTGDSNIIGSLNITSNLTANSIRAASLIYGDQLDIRANGTIMSATNRPAIQADGNYLYLDSRTDLYINTRGGTINTVQVGPTSGSSLTFNVSGTIMQQNVNVCLQNGSNCPSSMSGANVTGSGAVGTIPKWVSATELGNSIITEVTGMVTVGGNLTVGAGYNLSAPQICLAGTCRTSWPAGGDVTGPASSTDNAVARFDSTTATATSASGPHLLRRNSTLKAARTSATISPSLITSTSLMPKTSTFSTLHQLSSSWAGRSTGTTTTSLEPTVTRSATPATAKDTALTLVARKA